MPASQVLDESRLYPVFHAYLNTAFAARIKPSHGESLALAAVTDKAGPAASGIWTRPDLSLIHACRYKYQPTVRLDVYGFEVKRDDGGDVRAVHEAMAHRRFVHFAYVVWHYPAADFAADRFLVVAQQCKSHGLGLITLGNIKDDRTFKIHLDADRAEPDENAVDDFIETRFAAEQKERLLGWLVERR